jgi:hypothetical protein
VAIGVIVPIKRLDHDPVGEVDEAPRTNRILSE